VNILLVDYKTSYLDRINKLLDGHEVSIIEWTGDLAGASKKADAIVLTGGHGAAVSDNDKVYRPSLDLIEQTTKPLLGICLGCQLLAYAYGGRLKRLPERAKGLVRIEVVGQSPLLRELRQFEAFESHRWSIESVTRPLSVAAQSRFGIEAIEHDSLPHFGVQFHPEMLTSITPGYAVMGNFLRMAARYFG
jgi:GMP synthase-like glutamine amidotransferase